MNRNLSPDQFPRGYRSKYGRAQEIGRHLPPVSVNDTGETDAGERRAVLRHYSRSQMPGEHLRGMAGIRVSSDEIPVTSAMYDPVSKVLHTGFATSGTYPENRSRSDQADIQHALVHEVGHHQTGRVQMFGGEGVREGLAENYAEHYRSSAYSYRPSTYDASYKGDRSREGVSYRKTRRSKEMPRGHGEF